MLLQATITCARNRRRRRTAKVRGQLPEGLQTGPPLHATEESAECRRTRTPATYNSLRAAAAQLVDFLLHFVELALQVVDIAGLRRGLSRFRLELAVGLAPRERREHREGALEHFHVPPHLILKRWEPADAEGLRHLLAELLLLAGQRLDRDLEIARNQHLHTVAVEPDELAQERNRQEILSFFILLLEYDLRQHRAGDLLAGLGVVDHEILACLPHGGEIFERDVATGAGVVEAAVSVLFNGDRFLGLGRSRGRCWRHGVTVLPPI